MKSMKRHAAFFTGFWKQLQCRMQPWGCPGASIPPSDGMIGNFASRKSVSVSMRRKKATVLSIGLLVVFMGAPIVWADGQEEDGKTASIDSDTTTETEIFAENTPEDTLSEGGVSSEGNEDFLEETISDAEQPVPIEGVSEGLPQETDTGEVSEVSKEGLVSLDFKEADIRQVLRILSLKSGVDIVAGSDVEGLVTIKLTDVPWEQALDIILRTYGFTYERKGKIVRVMTIEALEQEALSTEVFLLNYAKAESVPEIITEMLSDRGRVKFDERTNTIIVTDIPTKLFQIHEVIKRLDQRTPQVLIETRIVETKLEEQENLGIEWAQSLALQQTASSFGSSFPFDANATLGVIGDSFVATPVPKAAASTISLGTLTGPAFTWTLNILRTRSDTKIVSNPTLAVLNNQEASIHIGEDFPIPNYSIDPSTGRTTVSGFETKRIGTLLMVTPHVNPSSEIVVDMKPEIISALSNQTFDVGGGNSVSLPRFSTQTVTTQIRIGNGQTIAIGGLLKETEVTDYRKVPFFGDLPVIGAIFKNRKRYGGSSSPTLKQDLLIFLTVNLLGETPPKTSSHAALTEP